MAAEAALTQLRRGVLEYCVLALLVDGERYGYDLVSELSAAGLVASEGTIYPLLSRLRNDELVATTWRESDAGPPRRYYSLTAAGREALAGFRVAWGGFKASVDAIVEPRSGVPHTPAATTDTPPTKKVTPRKGQS